MLIADTIALQVGVGSTTCKIQSRLVKIQLRSLAQEEDEEAQTIGALFLSRLLRRNVCECLASLLPPSLSFPHTSHSNLPSQPLTFFFPVVLDVFWDEQSLGRGRSQTYDLSEDGTKRRRLEAWAWLVGLDNQSYIQIGRLCSIWPFPDAAPPVKHEIRNSVLVLNTIFPPIASNSWKCTYILVLTSYLLNVYDKPLRHQWYFKVF